MINKKIGILTMHKIINFGSALQAYALQKFISNLGYKNCEIIDFLYAKNSKKKKTLKGRIVSIMPSIRRKKRKFHDFWNKYLKTSNQTFTSSQELTVKTCNYDIYLTGSDQVWNPSFKEDVLPFMFSFIEDGNKMSYAASFSTGKIENEYKSSFSKYLSQYKYISVRETSALPLIKELTGKEAVHVCDPTFLLDNKDWDIISKSSKIKINEPYILIYILSYAYNPFPQVFDIIEKVRKELKYKVIFIDGSLKYSFKQGYKNIRGCGPADFIYLIQNAAYVITTSFHGTAFAINFKRPVFSVIQPDLTKDSRMYSLLEMVGLESRAVIYNEPFEFKKEEKDIYTDEVNSKIERLINNSKSYLKNSLINLSK